MLPPHLFESGGGRGPALVQHVLGQVPVQRHEEGVAHVIQEVLVLGTALLVAVDEALDEPVQLGGKKMTLDEIIPAVLGLRGATCWTVLCVPANGVGGLSPTLGSPPGQDRPPPGLDGDGYVENNMHN